MKELASCFLLDDPREAESMEDMQAIRQEYCIAKFNQVDGYSGYRSQLFLIQPDLLSESIPAVRSFATRREFVTSNDIAVVTGFFC
jgi:hypothetical protein